MTILFDGPTPFLLSHGGLQVQVEQTKRALESLGLVVDLLRWWDPEQSGDVIHFFGRPNAEYIELAQKNKIKIVMSELLTGLGSRSPSVIGIQRGAIRFAKQMLPRTYLAKMGWEAYSQADAVIALTSLEAQLMQQVFGAPPSKIRVVPNGVAEEFLQEQSHQQRKEYLVCTATVTERKRVVELAEAAIAARTPLWVIGKPYGDGDQYFASFLALVKKGGGIVRYEGAVNDVSRLADIYRSARGFVLLSSMESLSLSALEAAACGCPLLLSDLPWARSTFGAAASYCSIAGTTRTAKIMRDFYNRAPQLSAPLKPASWTEVAVQLKAIYEKLVSTSR